MNCRQQGSIKQPLLTSVQIFEKGGIEGVKDKRCWILCELESVKKKKSKQLSLAKASKLSFKKKHMEIVFSKVIFTGESQITFDGPDGWAKGWILSNSDVPMAERRQQESISVMMVWAGNVDETIIEPF